MKERWTYKVVNNKAFDDISEEEMLNLFGGNGWILCSVTRSDHSLWRDYYFHKLISG